MKTGIYLNIKYFYEANKLISDREMYVLKWFIDFYNSGDLRSYSYNGEKGYLWFSYSYFLKDNPFFGIKTRRGLYNLIKRLDDYGFIKINPDKQWMRDNRKLLIKFTDVTLDIIDKINESLEKF